MSTTMHMAYVLDEHIKKYINLINLKKQPSTSKLMKMQTMQSARLAR
jgi:hypothetical protein